MAPNVPKPATILEHCRIGQPGAMEQSVPLTFFDLPWLYFHPIQRLLFYEFPCSTTYFLEKIVPNFKYSLSQTLKHFLPLAGNVVVPLDSSSVPENRFVPGDSISLIIAELNESSDFNYLTGNEPRMADKFYALYPELPEPKIDFELDLKSIPLFAVQITLFPSSGICVGFTNHHVVGDASSIVGFIKTWSSVAKLGGDADGFLTSSPNMLPIYDRSLIKDPSGLKYIYWNKMKTFKMESFPLISFPLNRIRATYILKKEDVQRLRNIVQANNPTLIHLSSFTITTAYVWTCLAKSVAESGEEVDDDEPEYFGFTVDARARMDPPTPAAYFGNCLAIVAVEFIHAELTGEKRFEKAVKSIGEVISEKVNNKDEILRDAEHLLEKFGGMMGRRVFGVSGSPKFDMYGMDFGWGKPKKYEAVGIDADELSMSLYKSREFEGGLEIGLSLSPKKMDAFAAIFSSGLNL